MPLLPSALPPKGEARRYVANDFLNLIALPQWGRQRGGGFAAKRKPTPPRCARQPLPREGARVDTPSFLWKEVPRRGGGWMGEAVFLTQSVPRVGKVASGASRIGFWRYERERGRSSQVDDIREHPSAAQKGSQPRLAVLGSPFQGKGIAWTLPPSSGRMCPEGAEVGWGKRYERAGESSQVDDSRKHPLQTAYKTYL